MKHLKLFGIAIIFVFFISFASAFDWTDNNIIHYYSSENASMTDNLYTLNGTNTGTTSIGGIIGNARYYDGTTMVNFSNSTFKQSVFYSFWFMTNSTGCTGDGCAIYSQDTGAAAINDYITIKGDEIHYVFGAVSGNNNVYDTTSANINVSQWTHVVVNGTGDGGTGKYQIWVNGVNQSVTFASSGTNRSRPSTSALSWLGEAVHPTLAQLQGRIDEFMIKNATGTAQDVADLYNSGAGLGYGGGGVISINVTLNSPANNTQINTNFSVFNATLTNSTFTKTNATFTLWFNNGTLYTAITNTTFDSTPFSTYNISLPVPNTYHWNVLGVQGNGNGTNSSYASDNRTLRYSLVTTNQNFLNATNYETAFDYFVVNLTTNGTTPTNAFLVYNGTTVKTATITSLGNNMFNLSSSLDIPAGVSNNSLYFNFTLGGVLSTTDTTYQNVLNSSLMMNSSVSCGTGFLSFLNISFADENNLTTLLGESNSVTTYYWLGTGTTFKSLNTSNVTANRFYNFCLAPQNRTLGMNLTFQYSAEGYPARIYSNNTMSLTNSTYNRTLYSLNSADGIYVTFQVVNIAEQVLSGVTSNITRTISGTTATIGAGLTGADGGITYWLSPDNTYTANFFKTGYPSFTSSQAFTQTSYTIVLGSASSLNISDYQKGINYTIQPSLASSLNTNTSYIFNFSITSSFWALENYGFNITNGTHQFAFATVNDTTSDGGTVTATLNTSGNQTFTINYFWTVNGTNTSASATWVIVDFTGNSFSLARLVTDFVSYLAGGLFGLDSFGIGLIAFVIIITTTGVLKVKVGISNSVVVLGVMWALVAMLDVSFGLIPNPVGAVPNFPTIFMGLIFSAMIFKEVFN